MFYRIGSSISESSRPILEWQDLCSNNNIISNWTYFILERFQLKLHFDFFINNKGPSPGGNVIILFYFVTDNKA
jgi:hypothetical protein